MPAYGGSTLCNAESHLQGGADPPPTSSVCRPFYLIDLLILETGPCYIGLVGLNSQRSTYLYPFLTE